MNKLKQILLVDDDEVTNFINEEIVKETAIAEQVATARNGLEALQYIEKLANFGEQIFVPELILLDINMPEMNGFQFLKELSAKTYSGKKPVVVMMLTTSLIEEDKQRLQDFNDLVAGIIEKPLNRESLLNFFNKHFRS